MRIQRFICNQFGENCYVIFDGTSKSCAIIDPGFYFPEEEQAIASFLKENNLMPDKILFTHCHLDHIFGAQFLVKQFPHIQLYGHEYEEYLIEHAEEQSILFGINLNAIPPHITHFINDGDTISIGTCTLHVIYTPGHSPGGVCFYDEENKIVFCGDTLFAQSIGRSDLYGGDEQTLLASIRQKLMTLPDDVRILSGHGPYTSIEQEKHTNPYI